MPRMSDENPFPIALAMHELTRLIRREFEARMRRAGFTEGQMRTLWHLERNQGISQARLAEILETQPISLVRVLDRLESAGLIERRPDPRDRRAVQLYLLPAAAAVMDTFKEIGHEINEAMRNRIGQADMDHFYATLQRMRGVFDSPSDQPEARVG
jgi:DNA-binding MarR family transcriptional regulator